MARGGSKAVTAIISFILGFLFAILVEVGAVFGVYIYATSQDIDTIMALVGLENTDEEGNHRYINTTEAKTLKDLISAVKNLIYDEEGGFALLSKSIGDIKNLVPATGMLLDQLYGFIGDYIDLDREKFENTEFTSLMTVVMDSLYDVKTATVLDKFNVTQVTGPDANMIVKSLLMGVEAEYATVNLSGVTMPDFTLPVFYDTYVFDSDVGKYYRTMTVDGNEGTYPDQLSADLLQETTMTNKDGDTVYKLYYVPCKLEGGVTEATYSTKKFEKDKDDGVTYSYDVLEYGEDTVFLAVTPDAEGKFTVQAADVLASPLSYSYLPLYGKNYYELSENTLENASRKYTLTTIHGVNFFRNNEGKIIQTNGLTLRNILEDPFTPLDNVKVTSVIGDNEQARDIFGDMTLGALMRGDFAFGDMVGDMPLSNFVGSVTPNDKLMAYMVYKLSDISGSGSSYTATYDKGGPNQKTGVTVNMSGGYVTGSTASGEALKGTVVKEISSISKNISLNVIMDIKADDPIMCYLGYGVTGAYEKSGSLTAWQNDGNNTDLSFDYDYVATYNKDDGSGNFTEYPCYVSTTAGGNVDTIWYCVRDNLYEKVSPVSVNDIQPRINSITDVLTLPDVIDVPISGGSTLMAHIAYGISSVKEEAGSGYTHTATYEVDGREYKCYISTEGSGEDLTIKDVWYTDGADKIPVKGAKIADLANSLDGLKVKDIFSEDEINKNPMLKQLKNKNVTDLGSAIDDLLIQTIYSKEVYGLPEDKDPMEVVQFQSGWTYFTMQKNGSSFTAEYDGTVVSEGDMQDGVIYYTYGDSTTTAYDPEKKLKIVGFRNGAYNSEWLYYEDVEGEYNLVHDGADADLRGNLTAADDPTTFVEGKYYSYGEAQGMWRLVLFLNTEVDGTVKPLEKAYTINNFNNMVNSCAENVYNSTLYNLQAAGVIDKDKDLSKTFGGKKLGDMTLEELINLVLSLP